MAIFADIILNNYNIKMFEDNEPSKETQKEVDCNEMRTYAAETNKKMRTISKSASDK